MVRLTDTLTGSAVVHVKHGSHTAQLQWRVYDSSLSAAEWKTFKSALDGYGGSQVVVGLVNAWNTKPFLSAHSSYEAIEDIELMLSDISVIDFDAELVSYHNITANADVKHGLLKINTSATDITIHGNSTGRSLKVSGSLAGINAALKFLTYLPDSNWYGNDTLNLFTTDNGFSGAGGALNDLSLIHI